MKKKAIPSIDGKPKGGISVKFKYGDKVLTNPDIKVQPSGWNQEGKMWEPHIARCAMTVISGSGRYYTCEIDETGDIWSYQVEQLIPYVHKPSMLEEVEEL